MKSEDKSPHSKASGDDDTRLLALEFLSTGELATEELDEFTGMRTTIRTKKAHAEEENQKLEDFGVFGWMKRSGGGLLLDFVDESRKGIVEVTLDGGGRWLLINDAESKSLVGFRKGAEGSENIRVSGSRLRGRGLGDCESDSGKKLAVGLDGVGIDADVEKWSIGRERARVLLLITMGGDEIAAVGRAVNGEFALGAAAHGADFFRFGRTEAPRLALIADWTKHERSPGK